MADRRIKLIYPPSLVDEPILYQLVRKYDLVTNLHRADVNAQGGVLELDLRGEGPVIDQALDWVRQLGIQVEEMRR